MEKNLKTHAKPYDIFQLMHPNMVDREKEPDGCEVAESIKLKRATERQKRTNCFATCTDNVQRLTRAKSGAKDIKFTEKA